MNVTSMTRTQVSLQEARRIAVSAQCLDSQIGKNLKLAELVDQLGYVQIDTIAIVARAHHHTLWNRASRYTPDMLHTLQAEDKTIFEYWAHALAYLPIHDYRFYMPRMERQRTSPRDGLKQWMNDHPNVIDQVLDRIRKEGPLTSKDFELPPGTKRGTWWDWKPTKRALEILFWQGHLMIPERRNFQKVYDLTERVLPSHVNTSLPSTEELAGFHVKRALRAMGIARIREIRDAFHIVQQADLRTCVENLLESGDVQSVAVAGQEEPYYALPETLERDLPPAPNEARILSPFDNLVIQRDRIQRLFDFKYTIECYLPEGKRKYGYFVLPVLWKDQLFARLDPKADRKEKVLYIKGLWFEPDFSALEESLPALAKALASYARFNGCERVQVGKMSPTGHKRRLNSLVRQALADRVP